MKLLIKLLIAAGALLFAAYLIPGIEVSSVWIACVTAVILALLNLVVRPILIVLTLPITILTLGLFIFVINAAIFWFAASFIDGFTVTGFVPALLGSVFVSIASVIGNKMLTD